MANTSNVTGQGGSGTSGMATVDVATDANLKALESLMDEFFSAKVPNNRKAEIDRLLAEFGQQSSCWRDSLTFLRRTSNPYVSMFSLTMVENTIRRRWVGMEGGHKTEIRSQLTDFLVKRHASIPVFIRNKVIKLLVDIACTDWPHFYPNFYTQIIDWILDGSETVTIGLTCLLIASEELATPRDTVTSARKEELRRLLTAQVPQTMGTLSMVLESLIVLFQGGATSRITSQTPPPTPSPVGSPDQDDSNSGDSMTRDGAGTLLHVARGMLNKPASLQGQIRFQGSNTDPIELATLVLKCLNHFFTWVPLNTVISPRLLAAVFHFAGLGMPSAEKNLESYKAYSNTQLAILAMGTINEIIYRHCVPLDFEDFLLQMFKNTFQLLQLMVRPETPNSSTYLQLQALDESYSDKFTEFIHSFVKSHLRRFESSLSFPLNEFLSLLFSYTFNQPRSDSYVACLDIWCTFVDFINGVIANRSSDSHVVKAKYHEALTSLVAEVLKKLQFRYNGSALEDLDDESIDDDEETEWQHYLRASIETIVKVSEILPDDVLRIVDGPWKETSIIYLQLGQYVHDGKIVLPQDHVPQLHHMLRDFASLLQIIGRLSVLFINEDFQNHLTNSTEVVKQLIELAVFGSKSKLYLLHVPAAYLSQDLVAAQAQALAALQAWCHWLSILHKLSLKEASYEALCKDLTSKIVVAVSAVLKDGSGSNRKLMVHSASHFLVTLTGSVRPPSIWKLREFTELYSNLPALTLDPEDHRLMVRALTNVLMLSWRGIPDQRWEERQRHLTKFLHDLTNSFRNIRKISDFPSNKHLQQEARPVIIATLEIVRDLAENVRDESTPSKKLCFECISEYVHVVQWLLPIYVDDKKICEESFGFFKTVLDVLKSQMGAEAVESVIQTVLTLFTRDQLAETVVNEGSGLRVVERLLEILQLVVKETDVTFRRFLDNSLKLCMENIYPLVAGKPSSDVKGPLYLVLYNILLHNWRHFFKSNAVRTLMIDNPSPSPSRGQVLHQAQFLAILQAFGQSFLLPDISVFKQNISCLEEINAKWKLYHKPVFVQNLAVQFLTVFLQVLINNSHNLLKDEISTAVYNMASVDFNSFFSHFLRNFIANQDCLDDNQRAVLTSSFKPETDAPSFNANMARFINDLRYYKICNASLPAGSVRFTL